MISVADNFGIAAYAICLFFLTILWSNVWGDATACPYNHMEDMIEGKTSIRVVALKTWAQIMGGCCVYRFVQIFWWFEFAHTHEGRAFENCNADLQVNESFDSIERGVNTKATYSQVHAYAGAFIEGLATLMCRLASRTIADLGIRHSVIIESFIGTSLVVAGNYQSL